MTDQQGSGNEQQIGTVARWITDKGYGFFKLDDASSPDVFCHISMLKAAGIEGEPARGQRYYFDIAEVHRGKFQAVNIRGEHDELDGVDEVAGDQ